MALPAAMGCLWAEVLLNLPWPQTWAGHWLAGVEPVLPFFPRHGSSQHWLQPGVSGPWLRTSTFLPRTWSWVEGEGWTQIQDWAPFLCSVRSRGYGPPRPSVSGWVIPERRGGGWGLGAFRETLALEQRRRNAWNRSTEAWL